MKIQYVNELTCVIGVSDLDVSIGWYEKVLGFKVLRRIDEIQWCEMKTGVTDVVLGLSAIEKVETGGGATPTWSVVDMESAKRQLDANDVRQDGDIQTIDGMVKLLTFYDPDGNTMMFAQPLA